MKQQIADLIQEIYSMNSKTFTVFIDIAGHVDQIKFTAFNTGWKSYADYTYRDGFFISECDDGDISRIRKAFADEIKNGERLIGDDELRKEVEIASLKAKLAQLES